VIFGLIRLPDDSPTVQFAQGPMYHTLTVFILVPFIFRLPKGKRVFRQYLDDIGLSRIYLFVWLMLLRSHAISFWCCRRQPRHLSTDFWKGNPSIKILFG
jgi:hypothetical protein